MKKKLSIRFVAALLCCALVIVPVICSIIYLRTSVSSRLEKNARDAVSFYMDQLADHSTSILDTLRSIINYLMNDHGTRAIMYSDKSPSQFDRIVVEEGLSRAFFLGNSINPNVVTGIYLVKNGEQYLSVLRGNSIFGTSSRIRDVNYRLSHINSARSLYTLPEYPDYCYFIVDYLDLESISPIGKIIIELDTSHLVDTSYIESVYKDTIVMLKATDGRTITGPSYSTLSTMHAKPNTFVTVNDTEYYYDTRSLVPSNLNVDIFVPKYEILHTIHEIVTIYIFFTIIILAFTLLLGTLMIHLLFKPLQQMFSQMDRMASGDLTSRMPPTPYLETEKMSNAFNNMADRLERLFAEVYEKGLLLRDAEFNLLESQIRPHFIFNVLELINMRCLAAGQNHICHTVSNLAQLLRANITHKHKQTITLQEELRYVRYYLELQKDRFEDSLNYSIDLEDPDMLNYYLPKLTIQPLIENSIVHGLENKRGGGTVRISIWEEEEEVCIRISDDGVGFDSSKLVLDTETPSSDKAHHNNIALYNISRRIQLLYGSPYGMQIHSSPGVGTDILLTLPIDLGPNATERNLPNAESDDR